eukprot:1109717-Pelagomonas_calceolata.AAC.1
MDSKNALHANERLPMHLPEPPGLHTNGTMHKWPLLLTSKPLLKCLSMGERNNECDQLKPPAHPKGATSKHIKYWIILQLCCGKRKLEEKVQLEIPWKNLAAKRPNCPSKWSKWKVGASSKKEERVPWSKGRM